MLRSVDIGWIKMSVCNFSVGLVRQIFQFLVERRMKYINTIALRRTVLTKMYVQIMWSSGPTIFTLSRGFHAGTLDVPKLVYTTSHRSLQSNAISDARISGRSDVFVDVRATATDLTACFVSSE